jgi:hypothetical protein
MSLHRISWAALFAGIALGCAQILLASHEIEHLVDFDTDACELCLTASPIGSSLPPTSPTLNVPLAPPPLERISGLLPVSARYFSIHHARAPPTPVRISS